MSDPIALKHLNPEQAAELLKQGEAYVVDNRDINSFNLAHIQGATHLSNESVHAFLESADRDKAVICCCYLGNSSQQVGHFLIEQGFNDVYNLDGGFEAWRLLHSV